MKSVLTSGRAELVGVCDCDEKILTERAAAISKKHGLSGLKTWTDYRRVCDDPEVDAITVCTTNHTHVPIALAAAAAGKHVYLEKPLSHNLQEGEALLAGQRRFGVIMAHGFQRRSETAWQEAISRVRAGELGEIKVAHALCYKPRKPIGLVRTPQPPPATVDYDIWSGPRPLWPVLRQRFHYDWHWQKAYGNGDMGNQGPHQLDVCRWVTGDERKYPREVLTAGGRLGVADNGETANTQVARFFQHEGVEIRFHLRGLPRRDRNWDLGMDQRQGVSVGNVIECEGGFLIGAHRPECRFVDRQGKTIAEFRGQENHLHRWVDAALEGKQVWEHGVECGHYSTALAHLSSLALEAGSPIAEGDWEEMGEDFLAMRQHLQANGVSPGRVCLGMTLKTDGQKILGPEAEQIYDLDRETYRKGFQI